MTSSLSPWGPPTTPIGVPAAPDSVLVFKPPRPAHPTLPLAAGLGALVVLTLSLLASKFVLDLLVEYNWPVAVYVGLLVVIVVFSLAPARQGEGFLRPKPKSVNP